MSQARRQKPNQRAKALRAKAHRSEERKNRQKRDLNSKVRQAIESADLFTYALPHLGVLHVGRDLLSLGGFELLARLAQTALFVRNSLKIHGVDPTVIGQQELLNARWERGDLPSLHFLFTDGLASVTTKELLSY